MGSMAFGDPESTTLSLSAAWRCLNILTNGIGALELFAIDDSEDSIRIRTPKVLADPWPAVSPVEWRSMVVASLALRGNAYMLPFDEDPRTGYPRQLPIVHPDRMHVEIVNGRLRYWLDENRVSDLDVLHIRGYAPPGSPIGVGVVEASVTPPWASVAGRSGAATAQADWPTYLAGTSLAMTPPRGPSIEPT
jgi:phage portal protein BeeE